MTELPTSFGKYYLTEKLATGGMAEIYLAKIIGPGGFEKSLVIKQIHPRLSGNRHFVDLFVAEAKTLVTLAHGNIVPVYELGVVDDTYFIAMDYIDGPTLYRLTETMARRESQMEPALAAWITARMLEGLDYAHRKGEGVIHRDLSPRNVMLSRDGEVKLVDFGIAVTLGEPGEGEGRESAPTGSFPYMSPEQVRREQLTPATDLFSVGVLMWEMLAGRRLFHRPDQDSTLSAVLQETIPRPSEVRPEIPAKLDEVVMRALERDRSARWASAGDMLAAINKYLYSLDETPGPRDVSALVARFCPPETRRLPTHLEPMAHDVISPEPLASPEIVERPSASGPATAVIPRDGSRPKGKTQRQKTFATNVDLAPLLDGTGQLPAFHDEDAAPEVPTKQDRPTTPRIDTAQDARGDTSRDTVANAAIRSTKETVPNAAIGSTRDTVPNAALDSTRDTILDQPAIIDRPVESARDATTESDDDPPSPRRSRTRLAAVEEPIASASATAKLSGREAPSRGVLMVVGLGGVVLAGAAIYMFITGRDRVLEGERQDAAVAATTSSPDASPRDASVAEPVAGDAAASVLDAGAGTIVDARVVARDAGIRRSDATATIPTPRPDAGIRVDAAVTGSATIKVGADPWGEIYVDGKLVGRTPRELTVSAGRHTVEIVFPAETPPRKQTFAIDLAAGETKPIQADFSN